MHVLRVFRAVREIRGGVRAQGVGPHVAEQLQPRQADGDLAGLERRLLHEPVDGRRPRPHPVQEGAQRWVERRSGTWRRRGAGRRAHAVEEVEHVAGVADQIGAVADQVVGAGRDPDPELARDRAHVAAEAQRPVGGDHRARGLRPLDDHDRSAQRGHDPVARGELVGPRLGAGGCSEIAAPVSTIRS